MGNYNPGSGTGADDTSAFASALASISTTHDALYVPPGNYKITSAIGSTSLAHAPGYNIYGDGMYASVLYMIGSTTSPGGATINISGAGARLQQLGFVGQNKIQNLMAIGFTAAGSSQANNYALVDNCRFGIFSVADSFVNAVYANKLTASSFRNCFIFGILSSSNVLTGNGINFYESVNNRVTDCQFDSLDNGIMLSSGISTQGLLIQGNVFITMNFGINIPTSEGTAFVSVVNNIIDFCRSTGIGLHIPGGGGNVSSNYVAVEASSPITPVAGISIANSPRISVVGNTIVEYDGSASQTTVGVALFISPNCTIAGNTTFSFSNGYYLDNTSNYSTIVGCSANSPFGSGYSNASTGSSLGNNTQS